MVFRCPGRPPSLDGDGDHRWRPLRVSTSGTPAELESMVRSNGPREPGRIRVLLAIFEFPLLCSAFRTRPGRRTRHRRRRLGQPVRGGSWRRSPARTSKSSSASASRSGRRRARASASIETLKAARPGIRVIALECRCGAQQFGMALKAGADGYLTREATEHDVVAAVRAVVAGNTYVSPTIVTRMVNAYVLHTPESGPADPYEALIGARARGPPPGRDRPHQPGSGPDPEPVRADDPQRAGADHGEARAARPGRPPEVRHPARPPRGGRPVSTSRTRLGRLADRARAAARAPRHGSASASRRSWPVSARSSRWSSSSAPPRSSRSPTSTASDPSATRAPGGRSPRPTATSACARRATTPEYAKLTSATHAGIGCESCHGPLGGHALASPGDDRGVRLHVAVPTDARLREVPRRRRRAARPPSGRSCRPTTTSRTACQCHDPHTGISRRPPDRPAPARSPAAVRDLPRTGRLQGPRPAPPDRRERGHGLPVLPPPGPRPGRREPGRTDAPTPIRPDAARDAARARSARRTAPRPSRGGAGRRDPGAPGRARPVDPGGLGQPSPVPRLRADDRGRRWPERPCSAGSSRSSSRPRPPEPGADRPGLRPADRGLDVRRRHEPMHRLRAVRGRLQDREPRPRGARLQPDLGRAPRDGERRHGLRRLARRPGSTGSRSTSTAPAPTGKTVASAFFEPRLCMQCENSPCTSVCPVGATYRTPDGVILVDAERCIGCGYCVTACPYGARYIVPAGRAAPAGHARRRRQVHLVLPPPGPRARCRPASRSARSGRASSATGTTPTSEIARIVREQQPEMLHPEYGTRPRVLYLGPAIEEA